MPSIIFGEILTTGFYEYRRVIRYFSICANYHVVFENNGLHFGLEKHLARSKPKRSSLYGSFGRLVRTPIMIVFSNSSQNRLRTLQNYSCHRFGGKKRYSTTRREIRAAFFRRIDRICVTTCVRILSSKI